MVYHLARRNLMMNHHHLIHHRFDVRHLNPDLFDCSHHFDFAVAWALQQIDCHSVDLYHPMQVYKFHRRVWLFE